MLPHLHRDFVERPINSCSAEEQAWFVETRLEDDWMARNSASLQEHQVLSSSHLPDGSSPYSCWNVLLALQLTVWWEACRVLRVLRVPPAAGLHCVYICAFNRRRSELKMKAGLRHSDMWK